MRNDSTPLARASAGRKQVEKIRRRHSGTKLHRVRPGLKEHVEDIVVVLSLAGYSQRQIASAAGVARIQVREILARPHIAEKLMHLRTRIPAAALELLEGLMIEAVTTIADVMRKSEDDKIVIQAAAEILDRAGLPKASRQERHNVNEEKTTLTDDGILEKLRSATPEQQEQAAQIIEDLERLLTTAVENKSPKGNSRSNGSGKLDT